MVLLDVCPNNALFWNSLNTLVIYLKPTVQKFIVYRLTPYLFLFSLKIVKFRTITRHSLLFDFSVLPKFGNNTLIWTNQLHSRSFGCLLLCELLDILQLFRLELRCINFLSRQSLFTTAISALDIPFQLWPNHLFSLKKGQFCQFFFFFAFMSGTQPGGRPCR